MEYNLLSNLESCRSVFQDAATLVYYTHIPPAVVCVVFGLYVVWNRRDTTGLLLALISFIYSAYVIVDLVLWSQTDKGSLVFALWSLLGILSATLFFIIHWFVHSFLQKRPLPTWMSFIWFVCLLPVILFTPTTANLLSYDIANCAAIEGSWFTNYYYVVGVMAMFLIGISFYQSRRQHKPEKDQSPMADVLVTTGALLFLLSFLATGALITYLVGAGFVADFGLEQYGIATMAVFIGMLTYATVRYHAFSLKLLGAQALVLSLIVLIASEFLFANTRTNLLLIIFTLFLATVFGFFLVRSVKAEVRQREEIEKLSAEKSEFMTFASHEIRNPITAMRGYASLIEDGTTGEVSAPVKDAAQKILVLGNEVLLLISEYLNKSKLELGMMSYSLSEFDLGEAVAMVVEGYRPHTDQKGLSLMTDINTNDPLKIKADVARLKEVVGNMIDNSLKYTPHGSITVSVHRHGVHARVMISDTGVGIPSETLPHLFQKFSRADAQKVNILGTGIGLYLAKAITEAMGGRIWAESDGKDKGSRFIIEFPLAN